MDDVSDQRKAHRKRQAGVKATKKKAKTPIDENLTAQQRNPRAFSIQHANKTLKTVQRTQDLKTKKQHILVVDRTPLEPPPIIVGVVGPPKVGKTTLLKCVVKNFTKQRLTRIQGPVTVVSGKQRRLTLIECNNDISAMIDIAKVADLVLLLVDASFGFEMETFEFLNICQVHGFPRIMGVLTHLDTFKDSKKLRKTKKRLKNRFWTEVFQGAKLFYLSGMVNGEYQKMEIHNLCRFISVMKFRPLTWRTTHPYILADRMEDITDPEKVRQFSKVDRNISLYGYLHGTHMKNNINVHIPGCGDFSIHDAQFLSDPCPTPEKQKKRSLAEKDRMIYAPMSGVGGIVYDKDAVYIDLGGSHSHRKKYHEEDDSEHVNEYVSSMMAMNNPLDEKMTTSEVTLFSEGMQDTDMAVDEDSDQGGNSDGREFETVETEGRVRRRAVFDDENDQSKSQSGDESDSDDEEEEDSDDDEEDKHQAKGKVLKSKDISQETLVFADSDDDEIEFNFHQSKKMKTDSKGSAKVNETSKKPKLGKDKQQENINEEEEEDVDSDDMEDEVEADEDDDSEEEEDESEVEEDDNCTDCDKLKSNEKGLTNKSSTTLGSGKSGSKNVKDKSEIMNLKTENRKDGSELVSKKTKSKVQENNESSSESDSSDESGSSDNEEVNAATDSGARKDVSGNANQEEETSSSLSNKLLQLSQTDYFSLNAKKKTEKIDPVIDEERDIEDFESNNIEDIRLVDVTESDDGGHNNTNDDDEEGSLRWKQDLLAQAAANFRQRQASRINYRKLIYGKDESEEVKTETSTEDDEIGGLFRVLKEKSEASVADRVAVNSTDCSKSTSKKNFIKLDIEEIQGLIADCFVTGKWDDNNDAEALLQRDDELYGDFEDLETGETHTENQEEDGTEDKQTEPEEVKKKKSEMTADERRTEKKRKLKEMFDTQYDMKGDTEYYDTWKEELEQQAQINRSVFEDMDDELRVQYEGFRPGMYVRVEIHGVPCEFVTNFDATYPVILGGLLSVENNVGYVQTRLKKHRWHKKILKTKNPLIISLGWRRFQSIPLYAIQDHNMRNRLLKYTPEHLHCQACFWGPITPQGTGLLAVENVANITPDFRIAATGVVVELDKSQQIVKKLKLTGTPQKIYNKTAFVEGMFNSTLEVAKFEGASVRTVSGVRGQIKKAAKLPEGAFRATFEDKIVPSDIVFLRTWYPVDVPQFYNPVTSLLLPRNEKQGWTGLKTLGQLHREKSIKPTFPEDSTYKKIERFGKSYQPLVIPRALQKMLPFSHTPKSLVSKQNRVKRVAIIREPHEAKVAKMMKMLKNVYQHKERSERMKMKERVAGHQKKMQKVEEDRQKRTKEAKKEVFRMLGKMESKKNKHKDD